MAEYVVRDAEGRFLGPGRRWFAEFPDAMTWEKLPQAIAAARGTKVLCEVIEDYGTDTEHTVETVG